MQLSTTLLLGLIAGGTIFIGLPLGRMHRPMPNLRVMLNAIAVGVLLFLLWDVFSAGWEPVDVALGNLHTHDGGFGPVFGYGALFGGGLAIGLLSLVHYDRYMARRHAKARSAGPGAQASVEVPARGVLSWSAARRLSLLIAVGIGLHNFAEGLAIGQSAASNDIALAATLVIGFALHNGTEGFGIVAPLAADTDQQATVASWPFLLAMGLIGGGPTFIGTWIGHGFTSDAVSVIFLSLAAGSIVYVVAQLLGIAGRSPRRDLVAYGLLIGLAAGFLTDAIITAAGV